MSATSTPATRFRVHKTKDGWEVERFVGGYSGGGYIVVLNSWLRPGGVAPLGDEEWPR